MSIAQLIRDMAALGAPADAIALAVEAIEATQAKIDEKRAVERDRKRRQRDRDRDNAVTVTGQSRDTDGTVTDEAPLSLPPNEIKSNPPTHTPEKQTPRARKGTRLPDDWSPEPLSGELATSLAGWPPGALDRELARFRDWAASASGPNAKKSNWQAAWRNWVRRAEDEGRYRNGKPQQHRFNERESTRETAMRLAARLEGAASPR